MERTAQHAIHVPTYTLGPYLHNTIRTASTVDGVRLTIGMSLQAIDNAGCETFVPIQSGKAGRSSYSTVVVAGRPPTKRADPLPKPHPPKEIGHGMGSGAPIRRDRTVDLRGAKRLDW